MDEQTEYIDIRMLKKDTDINKYSIYNKSYYIKNIDIENKYNHPKIHIKNIDDDNKYDYAKIPIKYLKLPSIEIFENYNETKYILLKYEYLEYNDYVEKYFKLKGAIISNDNIKTNIYKTYFRIKELQLKMR